MSKGLNQGRFVTSPRRQSQPPLRSIHTPWAPKHPCARPKSIPPTFGTPDMTVLPPTRNMSEILDGGKVCNFPQISNKRVPSSVQKSQKQARPRLKHAPLPIRFPIRTLWAPKLPLHQPQNPSVLRPPPHPTHQPPPSSITPELVPRRRRPTQPQPQRPHGLSS